MKRILSLLLVVFVLLSVYGCDNDREECFYCGEELLESARFCAYCGETVGEIEKRVHSETIKFIATNSYGASLIPTYIELFKTDRLAKEIATKVMWDDPQYKDLSYSNVKEMISISNIVDTNIIALRIKGDEKDLVKAIARAYAEIAPDFMDEMMGADKVLVVIE